MTMAGTSGRTAVTKDTTFSLRQDLGDEHLTDFLTRKILGNVGHPNPCKIILNSDEE